MNYEFTPEERLKLENLKLKRQLVDSELRIFMAGIVSKCQVPPDSPVSFTETHLIVSLPAASAQADTQAPEPQDKKIMSQAEAAEAAKE